MIPVAVSQTVTVNCCASVV